MRDLLRQVIRVIRLVRDLLGQVIKVIRDLLGSDVL